MGIGEAFLGSVVAVCSQPLFTVDMKVSDQVRADAPPAQMRGIAWYALRKGGALPV